MSAETPLTSGEAEVVVLLSQGRTPEQAGEVLGRGTVSRQLAAARHLAGVETDRALVYVCLAREWIDRPPLVRDPVELDEDTELVWAGLRLDVPDQHLSSVLSASTRTPIARIEAALRSLTARHEGSLCALITHAFAHGVLSGRESHRPQLRCRAAQSPHPDDPVPSSSTEPSRHLPRRTGRWQLTPQQSRALDLLATSTTPEQAADRLGVTPPTFRRHLTQIMGTAGVQSIRALVHSALRDKVLVAPACTEFADLGLTPEMRDVWRCLVLDVRDHRLIETVVTLTGQKHASVASALEYLRKVTGESDYRLIVRGWGCGVITADNAVVPPPRALPPVGRRAGRAGRAVGVALSDDPAGEGGDPLQLVPDGSHWPGPVPGAGIHGLIASGTTIVTGRDFDVVRVPPDACRQILAGIPSHEWGPVLGHPEGRTALFVTAAQALGAGWRGRHGRLWQAGATVHLPPKHRVGTGGMYWAVSCRAPLWAAADLEILLNTLPAEDSAGGR